MKPVRMLLWGLMLLIIAVQGCCCFGDRWQTNCCHADHNAPVVGALTPPEVTLQ